MSDVPELDRLIEEADNVRRNTRWETRDRIFRHSLGYLMLCVLLIIPSALLLGPFGVYIIATCAVVSLCPAFCLAVSELLKECFTDPPPRDPTKRYTYK